jgi:hypothetical protein
MKKSFLLYIDALEVLNVLTDEQAGQLFKAIRSYQLGIEPQLDPLVSIAMAPFIQHFKRDDEKYLMIVERNRANGLKNSKLKHETQSNPVGSTRTQSKPMVTDNGNDNGNDNDTDKDNDIKKKNKQKKFEPPTLQEVQQWFTEQGSTAEQGTKAWNYYNEGNWIDAKGQPVKNWRQKMRGGRWLEVLAQTKQNEGQQYQNLTNERTYQNLTEFNDFFTAE